MHDTAMWMGGSGGPGFGFFPFWPLLVIFFWFGLWRLIGAGHRGRHRHGHGYAPAPMPPQDPALITLRDRFARGEIDRAEYEERRAILLGRQGVPDAGTGTSANTGPNAGTADTGAAPKRGEHGADWPDLV